MNPEYIQDIITMLKDDKSVAQPYRNYALKELHLAVALVEKGQRITNLKPPEGVCTCPDGAVSKSCPVHGTS